MMKKLLPPADSRVLSMVRQLNERIDELETMVVRLHGHCRRFEREIGELQDWRDNHRHVTCRCAGEE